MTPEQAIRHIEANQSEQLIRCAEGGIFTPWFLDALADAGYAVVPVEPTFRMREKGLKALVQGGDDEPGRCYKAMIAAAKGET